MSAEKLAVQIYVDSSTFWILYQPQKEITWDFYDTAKNILRESNHLNLKSKLFGLLWHCNKSLIELNKV